MYLMVADSLLQHFPTFYQECVLNFNPTYQRSVCSTCNGTSTPVPAVHAHSKTDSSSINDWDANL